MRLLGADIGGHSSCTGATFSNPKGRGAQRRRSQKPPAAYSCATASAPRASAPPRGRHRRAIECTGATFSNPKGDALNADGLKTAGDVFLRDGFRAEGELLGADIGGNLECTGATFSNPKGEALNADRLKTAGSVFLRDGFHAEGRGAPPRGRHRRALELHRRDLQQSAKGAPTVSKPPGRVPARRLRRRRCLLGATSAVIWSAPARPSAIPGPSALKGCRLTEPCFGATCKITHKALLV